MSMKLIRKSSDMNSNNVACFGDCPKPKKSKPSDCENYVLVPNWAHLPSVVVHEIFDLLDKKDRQNAASVCKNWRQNLFHPKWWPSVTFKIEPCNIQRSKFCIAVFAKIVTNAKIKLNTLALECMDEFLSLVEALSENNNLKELIIEPSHCHFDMSRYHPKSSGDYDVPIVIQMLMRCLPNLVKFSIGCVEEFVHHLEEYLTILGSKQSKKIQLLGLASVKDNPNEYEAAYFDPDLIRAFRYLKVLSIDFDQLSDRFLKCLESSNNLERLIVHLHGIRDCHPATSNATWREFKDKHPGCELRLTVIHSFEEITTLENTVLREEMPLTHFKVFFCENMNLNVLDTLTAYYSTTLRSVMWVDSLSTTKRSWTLTTRRYDSPDPLVMMSWLCKNLEELVLYGYKYCEENLTAIARLRGDKLINLEVAEDDVLVSTNDYSLENFLIDVPLAMKKSWAPIKTADLHPVLRDPTAGDSDEYLLPIVLADLH